MSGLILIARTGSHAYGTQHAGSDDDYRGIFLAPTRDLYRLRAPDQSVDVDDPDLVLYELLKFATLAVAANPTAPRDPVG